MSSSGGAVLHLSKVCFLKGTKATIQIVKHHKLQELLIIHEKGWFALILLSEGVDKPFALP